MPPFQEEAFTFFDASSDGFLERQELLAALKNGSNVKAHHQHHEPSKKQVCNSFQRQHK